ncbi:MAG TPA: potassium-transporting ATPase subunit KdpC [Aggregatilineaceae bacterium]|nr:potassium-transporting ATPase subunit KdpC [Aggregatilineaceae bacterium]
MNEKPTSTLLEQLRPALVILALLSVLTGLLYPLAMTGLAQLIFPHKADGGIITRDDQAVGSELIGQSFDDPKYFWGRLSTTGPVPYNAAASTGSNYGPLNPALTDMIQARIDALHAADPQNTAPVPVDLVTSSGSGLDPDISPAAAYYQVPRVARERGLDEATVRQLVDQYTEKRQLGVLGEERVNVLELNLALDALQQ